MRRLRQRCMALRWHSKNVFSFCSKRAAAAAMFFCIFDFHSADRILSVYRWSRWDCTRARLQWQRHFLSFASKRCTRNSCILCFPIYIYYLLEAASSACSRIYGHFFGHWKSWITIYSFRQRIHVDSCRTISISIAKNAVPTLEWVSER